MELLDFGKVCPAMNFTHMLENINLSFENSKFTRIIFLTLFSELCIRSCHPSMLA